MYGVCTAGGRPTESWGLTESSGDNPGDSEIPLDLVFLVRESMARTGKRTPTGAGKPGRTTNTSGWAAWGHGSGPRGGSGSGRSEKSLALGTEPPGNRGPRAQGYRAEAAGAPQLLPMSRFGGVTIRWHGLPGQRERRREATEPACRQTGPRLRQRGPVRRAPRSERHSRRGTGGNARTRRGRIADRPGVQLRDDGRFADPRLGVAANIGRPMDGVERQRVRATGPTAENGHRPPNLWSDGRCDDRAKG